MLAIKRLCLPLWFLFILLLSGSGYGQEDFCNTGEITRIHAVQGIGSGSPMEGETVTVEGLVTRTVTNIGSSNTGFYLQEPSSREDGDETTSEGIFISADEETLDQLAENDLVRLRGDVSEFFNETRIVSANPVTVCQPAGSHVLQVKERQLPNTVVLQQWQSGSGSMEPYEGMKVLFTGVITSSYGFNYDSYRNTMTLARSIQYKPSQLVSPGPAADSLAEENRLNRIVLEEGDPQTDGKIGYYPQFESMNYPLRVSSTVNDIAVVIGYGYGFYFMVAIGQWGDHTVTESNEPEYRRTSEPLPRPSGSYRVAVMNVLNFFTDEGVQGAPGSPGGNRGADNPRDLKLQRAKLVNALLAMDADIVGLLEIGNNGQGTQSAINNMKESLNFPQFSNDKNYQFIYPEGQNQVGTDAISVGLLYRPAVFTPGAEPGLLDMPQEVTTSADGEEVIVGQRTSLAQEFCLASSQVSSNTCLTVVVNHFKSKGCSDCADDDDNTSESMMGCCNRLRVSAAVRLGDYIKSLVDNERQVLSIGDYNAYGEEDPVHVLAANTIDPGTREIRTSSAALLEGAPFRQDEVVTQGYNLVNLVKQAHGARGFSYSYDGELGSLDHALASQNLATRVIQVLDWHINALENSLFEYSPTYSGTLPKLTGPLSSSDHDPVIIDLNLSP